MTGATVYFSLSEYINRGDPVISKRAEIVSGKAGKFSAVASLTPADTIDLEGKYVYQFTVIDRHGNAHSDRGFVLVCRNTNKAVLNVL